MVIGFEETLVALGDIISNVLPGISFRKWHSSFTDNEGLISPFKSGKGNISGGRDVHTFLLRWRDHFHR